MTIGNTKGVEIKKGIWAFEIPQFKEGSNSSSKEWLDFRKNTIGASEIGTILNLNPYGVSAKLWWQKLGKKFFLPTNEFMLWGRLIEPDLGKMWQYYDGGDESYVENYEQNQIIRTCTKPESYIVNEKYPWLSASLDFLADANQPSPFTGEIIEHPFPIETKTISVYARAKYDGDIPPQYIAQVMQQMIVYDVSYAEYAALVDKQFRVFPIILSEEWRNLIIGKSESFWNKVKHGRELNKLLLSAESEEEEEIIKGSLYNVEPMPDPNPRYEEYIKAEYKESDPDKIVLGGQEEIEIAEEYVRLGKQITKLKGDQQLAKNKLLRTMGNAEIIDFAEAGKVTYKRPEGKRATFRVSIKTL